MKRMTRILGIALTVIVLLGAFGATYAQDDAKVLRTAIDMVGGDIPSLDPSQIETSASIAVANQIFIGLSFQDELTAGYVPGLASGWEIDGATYTFTIREGIPWVQYNAETGEVEQVLDEEGNVRFVTAGDFAYGIERSLNPDTASPYSYVLLDYITGSSEYSAGEAADFSGVGVEVIDDQTLTITGLEEGVAFADSIYGMWMAYAQPQWVIEEFGDLWTEPENINTYGPFALKEWANDESITIVKNPFWPEGVDSLPQPALDEVQFVFLDPETQFNAYQAGELDAIEVAVEQIDFVRADPDLSQQLNTGTNPCTYYLGFDLIDEGPISESPSLRRALSLAIDRQAIVENVTKRGETPAQWFARPGLNAAPSPEEFGDRGIISNVEAAQAEMVTALEELGFASVDELNATGITLSFNDSSNHASIMAAIQQMWADTLGVQVELVPLEPSSYFSNVSADAPMIYRSGWCQDYSDANNFLFDVFRSTSSQNDTGFNNADFDALIDEARTLTDIDAREELYIQAEELLVLEDVAIAPVYWYATTQLIKPNVEFTKSIVGQENYSRWDITE